MRLCLAFATLGDAQLVGVIICEEGLRPFSPNSLITPSHVGGTRLVDIDDCACGPYGATPPYARRNNFIASKSRGFPSYHNYSQCASRL